MQASDATLPNNGPIQSEDEFEQRLREVAKQELSPEEIREQKISFVFGMLPHDTTMTREQVAKIIDQGY